MKWGCLGPLELVLLVSLPFGAWMFIKYEYDIGNGKALRIEDANTVVIENEKGNVETVHLAGIDAPEREQPDGLYAQEQLAKLIAEKKVRVDAKEHAPNGTISANLYVDKVWVNFDMVQSGFAWVAPGQHRDPVLLVAEGRAKVEGRGLWSHADAIAPWIWRETHKSGKENR
jgi:endonuclease YncB( thermonuclease family)